MRWDRDDYRPGDFWRIDDRSGFKVRASRTEKEWDGLIVSQDAWEPRQPQDFVRGVEDRQAAPDPRPPQPPIDVGISLFTADNVTITADSSITADTLYFGNPVTAEDL